jgi:hypothetical protein
MAEMHELTINHLLERIKTIELENALMKASLDMKAIQQKQEEEKGKK